ncbi:MAG: metallophosphoesterase family protein [Clostridia bacterium]|nr:metallophosphoesterase family protein [Clostridia bacterium]
MQSIPLSFTGENFRVMQITDAQETLAISPDTMKLICAALDQARSDLVVFTGDQIKGYSPVFRGKNARQNAVSTIGALLAPLNERGIPFAVTYGNHDAEGALSNEDQFEIYKQSPGFAYGDPAAPEDVGTYCLTVQDGAGKDRLLIYLFDTHNRCADGSFGMVDDAQIDWYRRTRDAYAAANGAPVPSVAFQHIPTPEYYDILKRAKRFGSGSVRAYGNHKNEYYVLDEENRQEGDFLGESPATSFENSGQVDAFLEKGEMMALYVGHNHKNSFTARYKTIDLGNTQSAGFNVYGPGLDRGVRVLDFSPDGSYATYTLTYHDLCGDTPEDKRKYTMMQHMPTSIAGTITFVKETLAVLGIAALTAGTVYAAVKLKKSGLAK